MIKKEKKERWRWTPYHLSMTYDKNMLLKPQFRQIITNLLKEKKFSEMNENESNKLLNDAALFIKIT
jgi:hypothetical protein